MAKQPTPTVRLVSHDHDSEPDISSIKQFVTDVLQLPAYLNKYWDIIDYYPSRDQPELALAHYNDGYDPYNRQHAPLRQVRGIIVDLSTGAIVADSYGYTQNLPCYDALHLSQGPENPEGSVQFQTEMATYMNSYESAPQESPKINYGTRSFDNSRVKLFFGYEGAMARIFKWNGREFFSTHRKINAERSNWGGRTPFYELYQRLNGPELSSYFGSEAYSPYCYMFLIVDDEIRIASSTQDNRIIFIGVKKVWDTQKYADAYGTGPFELHVPTSGTEPDVFSDELNRALAIQPAISVDQANQFLFPRTYATAVPNTAAAEAYNAKDNELIVDYNSDATQVENIYFKSISGRVMDERLAGGDFVIMYYQSDDGQTLVYRLEPTSFEYRIMITGNDPNLYHHFVVEMVNFTKADPAELRSTYPRYNGSNGEALPLDDPEHRQVYWWSMFYDAVPPSYRQEVDGYLKRYQNDLNKVARFIMNDYPKVLENAQGFEEASQILKEQAEEPVYNEAQLEQARKTSQAHEELKRVNQDTQRRFDDLRRIAIGASKMRNQSPYVVLQGLLMKETGPSLYKMITSIRNIGKYRDRINSGTTVSVSNLNPNPPVSLAGST